MTTLASDRDPIRTSRASPAPQADGWCDHPTCYRSLCPAFPVARCYRRLVTLPRNGDIAPGPAPLGHQSRSFSNVRRSRLPFDHRVEPPWFGRDSLPGQANVTQSGRLKRTVPSASGRAADQHTMHLAPASRHPNFPSTRLGSLLSQAILRSIAPTHTLTDLISSQSRDMTCPCR